MVDICILKLKHTNSYLLVVLDSLLIGQRLVFPAPFAPSVPLSLSPPGSLVVSTVRKPACLPNNQESSLTEEMRPKIKLLIFNLKGLSL